MQQIFNRQRLFAQQIKDVTDAQATGWTGGLGHGDIVPDARRLARSGLPRGIVSSMIALRLPAVRPLRLRRFRLPVRVRAALPALIWCSGWLGLGLAMGALTDLVVRIVA